MRLSLWEVNAYDAFRLNYLNRTVSVNTERAEENNPFEVFWLDYDLDHVDFTAFYNSDDSFNIEKFKRTENEFYERLLTEKEKIIPFSRYGKKIFEFESMKNEDTEVQKQLLHLLQSFGHPFFNERKVQELFEVSNPCVIGLYGIFAAIQFYKQQIEKRIGSEHDVWESWIERRKKDFFTEEQSTGRLQYLANLYEEHLRIWKRDTAECKGIFNLLPEREDPNLVNSDKFEYEIINLYNILHNFEWNKKILVLCAGEV